jgi:hypothetical protein
MSAVLELSIDKAQQNGENGKEEKDTWILRLPKQVWDREGFAKGTRVSLTIKNSGIDARFIRPFSKKFQEISDGLKQKNKKLYEQLKRICDC